MCDRWVSMLTGVSHNVWVKRYRGHALAVDLHKFTQTVLITEDSTAVIRLTLTHGGAFEEPSQPKFFWVQ